MKKCKWPYVNGCKCNSIISNMTKFLNPCQDGSNATFNAVISHLILMIQKTVLLPHASHTGSHVCLFLFKQSLKYDLKKHTLNPLDKYTCIHPSYNDIHKGIHCNRHCKCKYFLTKNSLVGHHMFHYIISCFKGQNKQRL